MGKSSYNYQTQTKRVFERLKEISDSEGYSDNIRAELAALEAKLKPNLVDDLKRNEVELRKLIAYILVSYHYGDEGLYAYKINEDKAVKESIDILLDKEHYHKLLHK